MTLAHVPLLGQTVRLEPLAERHIEPLVAAAAVARDTYGLTWVPNGREEMALYVSKALAAQADGRALPFATVALETERVVGSTRFASIEYWDYAPRARPPRQGPESVEIGWTWLAADAQRTRVNTEAKLLMLTHAFEALAVERVMLKTDARNQRSRQAILRIGASLEGVLRRHSPGADGTVRDVAMFSILPDEWPAVKAALQARLAR